MGKDDQPDMQAQILALLEKVLSAQAVAPTAQNAEILEKLSGAMERLASSQVTQSEIASAERKRAARHSNEVVPNRSVFNPRGETCADGWQKPTLKCAMYAPWILENESLTREEIELLNLLEAGEYTITRIDDTKFNLPVRTETNLEGTRITKLTMYHETAFTKEYFRLMPPLHTYLRQMLKQHRPDVARAMAGVLTMDEEAAMIAAGQLSVSV